MVERRGDECDGERDVAARRFVERLALILSDAGFPRMAARAFVALLAADGGRLTAAELAERLQVSPAAVSGAVRYLVQVKLVGKEREPGSRRDTYRVLEQVWFQVFTQERQVLSQSMAALDDGIAALGADTDAGHRLAYTRDFFAFLTDELADIVERWRRSRGELDAPDTTSGRAEPGL